MFVIILYLFLLDEYEVRLEITFTNGNYYSYQ